MPEGAVAPDPATTTMTDSAPVPVETDWSLLDEQGPPPDDPMQFEDDLDAKPEDETEPEEEKSPATETTPGKTEAEDTPAEPEEEPTPTIDVETEQKLGMWDDFDKALREDPVQVANAIIESMDARQRAAFAQQYADTRAAFNAEEYEPQGEMEAALKTRWQDIETIPQLVSETKRIEEEFGQQIGERFDTLVPHVSEANVQAQINAAKIDALAEALGIELPDPDYGAIAKQLSAKNSTYRDAVRKVADYKKPVEVAKQRRAPRPNTPGSDTGRQDMDFNDVADKNGYVSMTAISRKLGYLKR